MHPYLKENKIKIFGKLDKKHNSNKFNNIMTTAKEIFRLNNEQDSPNSLHPLNLIIHSLALEIQYKYISRVIAGEYDQNRLPNFTFDILFFDTLNNFSKNDKSFYEISLKNSSEKYIDFSKDTVISSPWKGYSLTSCFNNIGENRPYGTWKEFPLNHNIDFYYPINIGIATNGFHSITVGIIQNQGIAKAKNYFDITPFYDLIYTDGVHYYKKDDNSILEDVYCVEFAAIYEIGRMLL